tara:strand:- start:4331 stop:4909 length:579 start_codon:yes stop_codon:yes gene_type:complete
MAGMDPLVRTNVTHFNRFVVSPIQVGQQMNTAAFQGQELTMKIFHTAALGFALVAGPAGADGHATGDAAAGEAIFGKCKSCHTVTDGEGEVIVKGGRTGPNLYGVFERVAGSEEDFGKKFGKSLVAAGEAGLAWNEEAFVDYVADPRKYLKSYLDASKAKSKMSFKLKKEEDARNVWAYLVSVGPAPDAPSE